MRAFPGPGPGPLQWVEKIQVGETLVTRRGLCGNPYPGGKLSVRGERGGRIGSFTSVFKRVVSHCWGETKPEGTDEPSAAERTSSGPLPPLCLPSARAAPEGVGVAPGESAAALSVCFRQ